MMTMYSRRRSQPRRRNLVARFISSAATFAIGASLVMAVTTPEIAGALGVDVRSSLDAIVPGAASSLEALGQGIRQGTTLASSAF